MVIDIFNTEQKYDVILADPPWRQAKGGKKAARPRSSGEKLDYPTLSLQEIKTHLETVTRDEGGVLPSPVPLDNRQASP